MPSSDDLCAKALTQRGDPYVFGAEARFDDPDPVAFDCSELVEWAAARLGVRFVDGAENQRDACRNAGTLMPVAEGVRTRGALLFRINVRGDHVAISLGDGKTIEARGRAYGVNVFNAAGRTWTHAGLVPGFERGGNGGNAQRGPGDRILRKGDRGEDVRWVQRRLQMHGFDPGAPDGIFGQRTHDAVVAFQNAHSLEVDGIVGPRTRTALAGRPSDPNAGIPRAGDRAPATPTPT